MGEGIRELLGTRSGVTAVTRVYRTGDAVEIDETEGVDVNRRRILLDEVLLVTRHRERGTAFVVTAGVLSLLLTGLAALVSVEARGVGLGLFAFTALPCLVALVWRLAVGVDVVTLFGERSRVALRFSAIRGRAGEVYRLLCSSARGAQRRPPPGRGE
jgi:hypothetical protein